MANETLLVLSPIGAPPYSARGMTQTHDPISAAMSFDRTVNGALINLSAAQFHKYKSTISGKDMDPPALDGIWPGAVVTVDCIFELSYLTAGGSPAKTVVSGSSRTADGFTFYRPRLVMMVMNFNVNRDEWGAVVNWRIDLEEQ